MARKNSPIFKFKTDRRIFSFIARFQCNTAPAAHRAIARAVDRVIESLLFGSQDRVSFAGRLLRPIAESEIGGLAGRVQWELMEAERKPGMREIFIEGMVLLGIAPHSHVAELASWAQKRGLNVSLFGSAAKSSDELSRLRRKD